MKKVDYTLTAMTIIRKAKVFNMENKLITLKQIEAVANYIKENSENGKIKMSLIQLNKIIEEAK